MGRYADSYYNGFSTQIVTEQITVFVKGRVIVPDSAFCYVHRESSPYDYHPVIAWQMERQTLLWLGSEGHRIIKNVKF
ncbi:MAG: hypothetical protein JXA68_00235 [Ignavibacteriales bacterium]|nr:hypothetical protein [Ignavibacteriales bacterium]